MESDRKIRWRLWGALCVAVVFVFGVIADEFTNGVVSGLGVDTRKWGEKIGGWISTLSSAEALAAKARAEQDWCVAEKKASMTGAQARYRQADSDFKDCVDNGRYKNWGDPEAFCQPEKKLWLAAKAGLASARTWDCTLETSANKAPLRP